MLFEIQGSWRRAWQSRRRSLRLQERSETARRCCKTTRKQFCLYFVHRISLVCHLINQYSITVHSVTSKPEKQMVRSTKKGWLFEDYSEHWGLSKHQESRKKACFCHQDAFQCSRATISQVQWLTECWLAAVLKVELGAQPLGKPKSDPSVSDT